MFRTICFACMVFSTVSFAWVLFKAFIFSGIGFRTWNGLWLMQNYWNSLGWWFFPGDRLSCTSVPDAGPVSLIHPYTRLTPHTDTDHTDDYWSREVIIDYWSKCICSSCSAPTRNIQVQNRISLRAMPGIALFVCFSHLTVGLSNGTLHHRKVVQGYK